MEKELWISVIIPVYNAEKFLPRAVESVLPQMDGRMELILVDDGSTDGSGALCDGYTKNHPNVTVIHRTNGGPSGARNAGIQACRGKYFSFLDSDDYVDADTYARIMEVLTEKEPDMLDFGIKYIGVTGDVTDNHHKLEKDVLHPRQTIEQVILPPLLNLRKDENHFVYDFPVNKIYRTDIVKTNGVAFDETRRTWEDRPFIIDYLRHCRNYYSMAPCFYNYIYTPGSLSQRYTTDYFRIIVENFQRYREVFGTQYDFDTPYVNGYWANSIWNIVMLSINQRENVASIRSVMEATLTDKQVVHWFAARDPADRTQREISRCIVKGDVDAVLRLAHQQKKKEARQQTFTRLRNGITYRLKRLLKKQ